jgi:HK97 family phage prohead protease
MRTQTKTASFPVPHGLPTGAQPRLTASTDDVDAERDRIRQDGLSHREQLPVLFAHGTRTLPVGMVTAVHRGAHRTEMSFRWLEGDAEAARVRNAYEQGALSASIGFQVEDAVPNELGGYDIRKARVHEVSLVPVPANEHARALTKALGAPREAAGIEVVDDGDALVEVDEQVLAAAMRTVIGQRARHEVRRQARGLFGVAPPEDAVLVLDDGRPDDTTVIVDEADVKAAIVEALAATVRRELTAALNHLTGRVD